MCSDPVDRKCYDEPNPTKEFLRKKRAEEEAAKKAAAGGGGEE